MVELAIIAACLLVMALGAVAARLVLWVVYRLDGGRLGLMEWWREW